MNNFFYAALGITLLIVTYRAFRREQGVSLNAMDMQFAKESIHEGLRCLGYAVAPSSASDAEALQAGYAHCHTAGMKAILTVGLVAGGMAAHYAMHKQKDAAFTGLLALRCNSTLAGEFNIDETQLWDKRNELYGSNADAKLIIESALRFGLQSCRRVQDGGELRAAILQLV